MPNRNEPDQHDGLGGLFSMLRDAVSPVAKEVLGQAVELLPSCESCGRKAIPIRCFICSGYACVNHGYLSGGRREVICRPCVLKLLEEATGAPDVSMTPWEVLGVAEGTSRAGIERAFRIKSKQCHPDFFPNDPAKVQEFRRIRLARERVLDLIPKEDQRERD